MRVVGGLLRPTGVFAAVRAVGRLLLALEPRLYAGGVVVVRLEGLVGVVARLQRDIGLDRLRVLLLAIDLLDDVHGQQLAVHARVPAQAGLVGRRVLLVEVVRTAVRCRVFRVAAVNFLFQFLLK